jgi:hypothetical protein
MKLPCSAQTPPSSGNFAALAPSGTVKFLSIQWRRATGPVRCGLLGLLAVAACDARSDAAARDGVSAEFGIFYGGQVQELDEIPFELDAAKQRQGFRLTVRPAPAGALEVRWEVGRPGRGRRVRDSQGRDARPRAVEVGRAHFRPGEPVFEQVLPFAPDDPLGLWNMRVLIDDQVVMDRPFVVFDAASRARRREAAADSDAGWWP